MHKKWAVFIIHLEVKNNLRVSGLGTKFFLLALHRCNQQYGVIYNRPKSICGRGSEKGPSAYFQIFKETPMSSTTSFLRTGN